MWGSTKDTGKLPVHHYWISGRRSPTPIFPSKTYKATWSKRIRSEKERRFVVNEVQWYLKKEDNQRIISPMAC